MTLNYRIPSISKHRRRPLKRFLRAALTCVLILAGLCLTSIAVLIFRERQSIAAFDSRTSQEKLVGKTADQILRLLGTPDGDSRTEDGAGSKYYHDNKNFVIGYEDSTGEVCRIEFTNGLAATVEHYLK